MKNKGFSLIELMIVIAIFSTLIGVMVQITLMYEKFNKEYAFLSSEALNAKEIGIKIENAIINASIVSVSSSASLDKIDIDNGKIIFKLYKNPPKKVEEIRNGNIITKKVSNEIYWKINEKQLGWQKIDPITGNIDVNMPFILLEISFYLYNKYSKKRKGTETKMLVYYIVKQKYNR
jgi:prepilin-type N-terminal cleavage/methylation domain-containing protein